MRLNDVRNAVLTRGWLAREPKPVQEAVLSASRHAVYEPGEPIYRSEDPWTGIYGLAGGTVLVQLPCRDGAMRAGHLCRPGFWFGLKPSGSEGRVMTLSAIDQVHLLLTPATALDTMVAAAPAMAASIDNLGMMRTRIVMQAAFDLMIRSADLRLAATLLRVEGSEAFPDEAHDPSFFCATQKHIAEMANVSTASVNKTLGFMEQAGWIAQRYNRIAILDREAILDFVAGRRTLRPVKPPRRQVVRRGQAPGRLMS